MSEVERRRYRRVHAPVLYRRAGLLSRVDRRPVQDISLGGFRIYSDDQHKPGDRLDLELFFPDGTSETVRAQVVWIEALADAAPAAYDVGLSYVEPTSAARGRIERVLGD